MMQRFTDIVDRYRHKVFTFAYYQLGQHDDAEDVTQEVFIRLWKHWDKVEEQTVEAWLIRVTKNACVDLYRRHRKHQNTISGNGYETVLATTEDKGPDPRMIIESADFRDRVMRALTLIEEPYRSILILRAIQDMSYAQISESLQMPLSTVKVYLHRGRRMLRERMKEKVAHETK
jgi:RNA polymerase sigma-70 factor (ECF subfamily)